MKEKANLKSGSLSKKYRIFFTIVQLFFLNFALGILDNKQPMAAGHPHHHRAADVHSINKPLTNRYLLFFILTFNNYLL